MWPRQQPWRSVWGQQLTGVTEERRKQPGQGGHGTRCSVPLALAGAQERLLQRGRATPNSDSSRKEPQAEGSPRSAAHQGLEKRESPIQSPPSFLLALLPLILSLPTSLPLSPPPSSFLPSPVNLQRTMGGTQDGIMTPFYSWGKVRPREGLGLAQAAFLLPSFHVLPSNVLHQAFPSGF